MLGHLPENDVTIVNDNLLAAGDSGYIWNTGSIKLQAGEDSCGVILHPSDGSPRLICAQNDVLGTATVAHDVDHLEVKDVDPGIEIKPIGQMDGAHRVGL